MMPRKPVLILLVNQVGKLIKVKSKKSSRKCKMLPLKLFKRKSGMKTFLKVKRNKKRKMKK
jgi:hypothetical protein